MSDAATLLDVIHFTADKHRYQRRKDPDATPYINHPLSVAELLARVGGVTDAVVLMAAVLHDTVEDTKTSFDEIEARFGKAVRDVVAEVTDDKSLTKDVRKQQQIDHAAHSSSRAKLVKLGDKICNVIDVTDHAPPDWQRERRAEYLDWSERVVAGCRGTNAALEAEFDRVLARGRGVLDVDE